jgi:uncharacterized protein YdcH (DUF465 family)
MSLSEPSAETITRRRLTGVRGLDSAFQRLIAGRDEADQRIAEITAAMKNAPSDQSEALRQAQIDKSWLEREISAAAAALEEARELLRQAERAERCEREDRYGAVN